MYMLEGKKYEHQRHINQLRSRYTKNVIEQEILMEVLYDLFDKPALPIPITERWKRKRVEPFSPDPKRKRY